MDQIAPFIIFLLAAVSKTLASSILDGARLGMRQVDFGGNFTKDELFARSACRSSRLSLDFRSSEYMIDLSIGTPPQLISGLADTGSDLIWAQCKPEQPTGYDPNKSETVYNLPCNSNECLHAPNRVPDGCCLYDIIYGTGSAQGYIISDTFRLGDDNPVSIPNMTFGCTFSSSLPNLANFTGIIGLSRSEYSLIRQLGIDKFSYCLDTDVNTVKPMFLGSAAILDGPLVQSTPLLVFPEQSFFYHVNVTGISLGSELLPIPQYLFQFNPSNHSGGVIIDSGTPITRLVPQAFDIVSQALVKLVNLPIVDDPSKKLCFSLPSGSKMPSMPDMIFHFDGGDFKWTMDKYMSSKNGSVFCLLILKPPGEFTISVIGTIQMQNIHVLYDLKNNLLSFSPAEFDKL
ncbi:hypothetical protein LUZ61_012580 [Rhynchospora tenuis]|uniref:Peptidase A1 domain-containing protein n=1 Tax=Rhynchospora tenuis TaxID=198213 RepID=A0AAD6A3C8_9POAL|nr:hypothetical protein LUZ61_012580 [Rhynchospora tenuis]